MVIGRALSHARRGVSLVECVVALTIIPLACAGIAFSVVSGQQEAAEGVRNERAATLAEALMEEILAAPYADPQGTSAMGPEAGETTRSLYDNMDDYHGFSEAAGSVKNAAGTLYASQYQTFQRSVTCASSTQTLLGTSKAGLLITVTVSDKKGTAATVSRFVPDPS